MPPSNVAARVDAPRKFKPNQELCPHCESRRERNRELAAAERLAAQAEARATMARVRLDLLRAAPAAPPPEAAGQPKAAAPPPPAAPSDGASGMPQASPA